MNLPLMCKIPANNTFYIYSNLSFGIISCSELYKNLIPVQNADVYADQKHISVLGSLKFLINFIFHIFVNLDSRYVLKRFHQMLSALLRRIKKYFCLNF